MNTYYYLGRVRDLEVEIHPGPKLVLRPTDDLLREIEEFVAPLNTLNLEVRHGKNQ